MEPTDIPLLAGAARALEIAGVLVIVGGVLVAAAVFVRDLIPPGREHRRAYERLRANLGRGILLGLELLVGADIIFTITAP